MKNPLIYLLAATLIACLLYVISQAHAEPQATGHIYGTVCSQVDASGNHYPPTPGTCPGFCCADCGDDCLSLSPQFNAPNIQTFTFIDNSAP